MSATDMHLHGVAMAFWPLLPADSGVMEGAGPFSSWKLLEGEAGGAQRGPHSRLGGWSFPPSSFHSLAVLEFEPLCHV